MMRSNFHTRRFTVLLIVLAALLLFSVACGPKQTPTPTITPTELPPTATPTPIYNIKVVDDGSALPPKVIEQIPERGQDLSPASPIQLIFDQDMDTDKTASAWKMVDAGGIEINGQVSWINSRTLEFKPAQALQAGTAYFASLSNQATSKAGLALQEALAFEFNTPTELAVSQVSPLDGASQVSNKSVITVIFNHPVVPLMVAEDQKDLPNPLRFDPELQGKGEWVNTSVYAFRPDGVLRGGTQYQVTVTAGLSDAIGGSTLASDYSWSFTTTEPGVESFWLTDYPWEINPPEGRPNVPLQQGFAIKFLQPMDRGSVESSLSIQVTNQGVLGERVPLQTIWDKDNTTIVFTPTVRMALGEDYLLTLARTAQAEGGGEMVQPLNWYFTTVLPPEIIGTTPADGETQQQFNDMFSIEFASPMRLDTLKDKVSLQPEPADGWQWQYSEGGYYSTNWSLYTFGLQPSTTYELVVQPGMEDLYGNKITGSLTVQFTTTAYPPTAQLQMPYEGSVIYRVGGPQEFYASYHNIREANLRLYRLEPSQFAQMQTGKISAYDYEGNPADLAWSLDDTDIYTLDKRVLKNYQPAQSDGSPLPPGFYLLTIDSPNVPKYGSSWLDTRLVVIASANLSFKTTNTEVLVWATDLTSGEPLSGLPVSIYNGSFEEVAKGVTDEKGLLYVTGLVRGTDWSDTFFAMTNDPQGFGFASGNWSSGVSPYDFGIWQDYYSQPGRLTAYVYTDRPIYRPGQPVSFKGVVRQDDDSAYKLPQDTSVKVIIDSFDSTVSEQTLLLSPYGTFDGKLDLDSEAALGSYTIHVRLPDSDEDIGILSFSVAEYRKPEFLVNVISDLTNVLEGDNFRVTIQASYYSGGPLVNAEVAWTLRASPFYFSPPDEYSAYSFTDYDLDTGFYYQNNTNAGESFIADGQLTTDQSGQAVITLPASLKNLTGPQNLTFEATVTDFAGTAVSGRTTITAHRSMAYPGIRSEVSVGQMNKEALFDVVGLDWEGNPTPGAVVDVEVVERQWYSVQSQDANGQITWSSTVKDVPAADFSGTVLDDKGKAVVRFFPTKGGVYRAVIKAKDSRGNIGQASAFLWVAGKEFVPWRQENNRGMELVTDRKNYAPGDTAEILIASPFDGEHYALVTVERGHIRSHAVVLLQTNSTIYELPVTADMAPSVYVSVLVIKGADSAGPPDFRLGLTQLRVSRKEQTLVVQVTPDKKTASPGEQVTYQVHVTDANGKPVSAELSLGLSDLAALSLADPNSAPILDYFYYDRGLSVWTAVPIVYSIEHYNAELAREASPAGLGMGSGGGKGYGEAGVIQVRGNFPDTAYWQAHIQTDQNGDATVTLTLPDNLTTWRMDARAVTTDTRVGQVLQDIVSTKPLLVRPQTPRFFVAGDDASLSTAVHNNTDQSISVQVSLQAKGMDLQSDATQTVEIAANKQALVTWKGIVPLDSTRVDLVFTAQGGGYSDASLPPVGTLDNQGLPVYKYEAPETVGTSGQMLAGGTFIEAISLPPSWNVTAGNLDVKINPSLAAGMTDGLTFLRNYPYAGTEQTVSSFLPNVITTRALKEAGLSDPDLEASLQSEVSTSLQRLYNWQRADGGWGWWQDSDESNPQVTAYVVLGFVEARAAGYEISPDVLSRSLNYLSLQISPVKTLDQPYRLNRQAFILYVLARAGKPAVSATVQTFDGQQNMAIYARALLAQTLAVIDAKDPRIATLLSDLSSVAITSAAGTHWEEKEVDYWNWNTDTRTTAIVLSALSRLQVDNPLNANAVRWLMSHRFEGRWGSTQETAWTLMGLTNWMVASGELQADYEYAVGFNGKEIGGGKVEPKSVRQSWEVMLDVTKLLTDQVNRLAIARSDGPGNLYYTAYLNVNLPVEQITALDRGVTVSRSYFHLEDRSTAITSAVQGDLVLVRVTVVASHDLHYLVVSDPLPAGLEAVDMTLSTSPRNLQPELLDWNDLIYRGWGWWFFNHIEMRDEKVVLSADYLPAGTYVYNYVARASTTGVFRVIPTTAQEVYFPDVYGRGDGSIFEVTK